MRGTPLQRRLAATATLCLAVAVEELVARRFTGLSRPLFTGRAAARARAERARSGPVWVHVLSSRHGKYVTGEEYPGDGPGRRAVCVWHVHQRAPTRKHSAGGRPTGAGRATHTLRRGARLARSYGPTIFLRNGD